MNTSTSADGSDLHQAAARRAGIAAWFSETLESTTFFDLSGGTKVGVGYRDA